jgi:hypothetical protein
MSPPSVKRGWVDPLPPLPLLLSPWEDHPDFGLVHSSGCGVCRPYMDHVAEASYSTTQPSFQVALEARNHRRDDDYYDGIAEGRRRQKHDDGEKWEDLERYRRERDAARDELEAVKVELAVARSAASQWEAECERLASRSADGSQPRSTLDHDPETSFASNVAHQSRPTKPTSEIAPSLTLAKPIASYASVASSQLPSPPNTAQSSRQGPGSPGSPADVPFASTSTSEATNQTHVSAQTSLSVPKHIRHLQSLCTAAHQPGNHAALARVKALCTAAHATPKERKTDAQRWLLSNWRSPGWERAASANGTTTASTIAAPAVAATSGVGTPMHPPRLDSPIDAWVAYLKIHPTSWPRGVRKDAYGHPVHSDVKASRIAARLRPSVSGGSANGPGHSSPTNGVTYPPNARNTFTTLAVTLFASPTLYSTLLTRHNINIAPEVQYLRYEPDGEREMKLIDVARHFAACGISEEVGREMGGWAMEYLRSGGVSG